MGLDELLIWGPRTQELQLAARKAGSPPGAAEVVWGPGPDSFCCDYYWYYCYCYYVYYC